MVDADNGVIVSGADFVTVTGVDTQFSKSRWVVIYLGSRTSGGGVANDSATHAHYLCPWRSCGLAPHGIFSSQCPTTPTTPTPTPTPPPLLLYRGSGSMAKRNVNGHHALWVSTSSNVLVTKCVCMRW